MDSEIDHLSDVSERYAAGVDMFQPLHAVDNDTLEQHEQGNEKRDKLELEVIKELTEKKVRPETSKLAKITSHTAAIRQDSRQKTRPTTSGLGRQSPLRASGNLLRVSSEYTRKAEK